MYDFKRNYDGTGRKPRGVQDQFFDWLGPALLKADCAAAQIPVGGGKSFIARTIQLAAGAPAVTPSNVLIDQYIDTYRHGNYLKGKSHYVCREAGGLTCADWTGDLGEPPCEGCAYQACKQRAHVEPTFFNPLSLYYFNMKRSKPFSVMVVDEAHQLSGMAQLLCQKRFAKSKYTFDDRCQSEVYLAKWMRLQLERLGKLSNVYFKLVNESKRATERKSANDKLKEIIEEMDSISLTLEGLEDDPQNYAIYFEEGSLRGRPETFLHVRPIRPPRKIVRKMLYCDKLVLLSGTLLPTDVEDLTTGKSVEVIDLPSPIPKDRRPIFYRPAPFPINRDTDPKRLVAVIEEILADNENVNTIIHTTYDRSKKMAPHFKRPVIINTPETKNECIERFKRDGGVFLAAGCAEGLDLKDDLCRLNIIPHLITPNLGDPVVKKRRALEDGDRWLGLETLKTTIQQAGRSTRHEKDFSKTYVLDPRFPQLIQRFGKYCPKSFTEAIEWRTQG